MSINLADDAVHALNRASAAAAREGADAISPGDILAGVISQRAPDLLEILGGLGLELEALPEEMRDLPETYHGHLPFNPGAHEVLAAAVTAASQSGGGATTSGHLLLGVARAADAPSRQALEDWGLAEDALAGALAPQPDGDPDTETATPAAGTVLLLALSIALACTGDTAPDAARDAGDPFASTPADGVLPPIGPAPPDYTPTAAGAPSTDIWLGRLDRDEQGELVLSDLSNATDRDGYDNQPAFDPAGDALYYTAAMDTTQTDTFRYLVEDGASERVTHTPDASEFSPTPIPGQEAFSAIHEKNGLQYLWRYGVDGSELGPIFATAEPVGYHAWADEQTVAMFILGSPPSLQVGDALSGEIRIVAENPGRSMHRIPGSSEISFVRKVDDNEWWIERLDPASGHSERIVRTPPGREDHAWTPGGEILMGDGTVLFAWSEDAGWREIADLGAGSGDISRIAVSPDGARIALVRNRTDSEE
ncbi:MAG: hypothetical protein F4Z31_00935 [Gemmatimonadetes bacterium]|nr:hypothetical protein [Gemmatimonadota bacterium]MYA40351.1 hypothetical protein [Gemmatimonadota bacterium]MYE94374.1 hypothetical protein [Gemmatimonadota bacterium]MYJ09165.1 hypothetical protein [Gemmatimonadota bacterium]